MSISVIRQKILGTSRKTRIVSASALFLALCAFGAFGVAPLAPDAADLPVKSITQELALPNVAAELADDEQAEQTYINEEKVRPGDSLASLLTRLGVDDAAAASFIKSDRTAHDALQLKPGKVVQAQTNEDGELKWLSTVLVDNRDNPVKNLVISRDAKGTGFKAVEAPAQLERRLEMHSGVIKSSLFAATDAEQIPDTVANQIVDMFSTDIDFASDLQRGDHFEVVYETFWQNGEFVRAGRVLAGEFTNDGSTYQSVWYEEPGSTQGGSYYGLDGHSLKKAFLKSPIAFTRISSGFSMRLHPILGIWKQHKGVDFAAAAGTPIHAAGDGVIDFEGQQNGYGNVVVVKHWSNYSTAYAHMSRFAAGIHKGSKVSQGDVIGYVGMTGWATGPHLHYEFRINNEPRDPMTVNIPNAQPLAGNELQHFKTVSADMAHRFALLMPPDAKHLQLASR
ncbi:MAG TPA: peptidoglycan DD-metalloendopeptidase family protein [Burkholderiaceae bacterium]|jgi:murein DD-endopeptidase MepM/ murein hydrolase activator NlpD|nr:peptidoglycan DD-metalloendopeptidase family protein [Burkholderiaceae bacterium]